MRFKFRPKFGLTLIELLIAISILGILTAITVSSYLVSQQRSRDAKRKADLDTLRKSLELAKADTRGSFYYPACATYVSGKCQLSTSARTSPELTPTYLSSYLLDPKTGLGYFYIPTPASCTSSPLTCTSYTLVACLENGNDADKDSVTYADCTTAGNPASYTVRPN